MTFKFRIYVFNKFTTFILGNEIKDYTSGLFVCKKEIFERINMDQYVHGEFTIELLFNLKNNNIKIIELPYIQPYDFQNNSKSFPSFFRFLTLGFYYIGTIFTLKVKHILNLRK